MKIAKHRIRLLAMPFAALMAVFLMSCGGGSPSPQVTVTVTATPSLPTSQSTDSPSVDASPSLSAETARVGDTLRLQSLDTTLEVTIAKVADPVTPQGFDAKPDNERWIAVYVKIRNVGDANYEGSVWNDTAVINTEGNQFDRTGYRLKEPALDQVRLKPGSMRAGWVTIDCGGKLVTLEYTPDGGAAEQTGEWKL